MKKQIEQQAEILAGLASLRPDLESDPQSKLAAADIINALEQFRECVRYLNVRRSSGLKLNIASEADVQDVVYLMLRPWVKDLVYENPTSKVANRYVIKDFLSKTAKTIIEAKFVRDAAHGKNISKELHDDIEMYRSHPDCEHIVFFIYDPDSLIPDLAALRSAITIKRVYDGKQLFCHVVVP